MLGGPPRPAHRHRLRGDGDVPVGQVPGSASARCGSAYSPTAGSGTPAQRWAGHTCRRLPRVRARPQQHIRAKPHGDRSSVGASPRDPPRARSAPAGPASPRRRAGPSSYRALHALSNTFRQGRCHPCPLADYWIVRPALRLANGFAHGALRASGLPYTRRQATLTRWQAADLVGRMVVARGNA